MIETESSASLMRKRIEGKNLPTAMILKLVETLLAKPKPTAQYWETLELLFTRLLWQIEVDSDQDAEQKIKKTLGMLSPMLPEAFQINRHSRNQLYLEILRLRFKLSYNTSFEELAVEILPQKRNLHARLATAICDINLMTQALLFTLKLRRRFLNAFNRFSKQMQTIIQSLDSRAIVTNEEFVKLYQESKRYFDGPYEDNILQFDNFCVFYQELRDLAAQYGLDKLFQPTIAEQVEGEIKEQNCSLVEQAIAAQHLPPGSTFKIVSLKGNYILLRTWEISSLSLSLDQIQSVYAKAVHEAIHRAISIVAALEDRNRATGFQVPITDPSYGYLQYSLQLALNHLNTLAAHGCTTIGDVRLSTNIRQSEKKLNLYLTNLKPEEARLSA
jgi:hypothetical protein